VSLPRAGDDLAATLEELREVLLRQSFRYGEFELASGATSRYYCDAKLTLLSPRGAELCGRALAIVVGRCGGEAVGGLAMGAAYLAAAIVQASASLAVPIYGFTVRAEAKDHGRRQSIDQSWHPESEPLLVPGRRVVVVDDVVTTGGSTLRAIEAVEATGAEIVAVLAIVDRQAGGAERFAELGLPFYALFAADAAGQLGPGSLPAASAS